MQSYIKSPLNYVGNKYRVLPELINLFPKEIHTFVDLCTGGGDVAANIQAKNIIANDINTPIIEILQEFQKRTSEEVIEYIDQRIKEFSLSKTNEEGYIQYRELYNTSKTYHTPLDLFTITRFSFNQLIRFNNKQELNSAFGRNRSDFNSNMRNNTIAFCRILDKINFISQSYNTVNINKFDINDFIYIDPPYLITNADYNTGKTSKLKWTQNDDLLLFKYLDELNQKGLRWATSNFIKHKENVNEKLQEWALDNHYNIYVLHSNYSKLTTKAEYNNSPTLEILITNYNQ